jgi:hypothetical protein
MRLRRHWADGLLEAGRPTGCEGTPRRQASTSKRQGWKAATFYVKPETLAQLRRVVGLRKLEGVPGDLSDAVEEALQAWLSKADKG